MELNNLGNNQTLVKLTNDKEEYNYVKDQIIKASFSTDWDTFMAKCKEYNFSNILKKESIWYGTFFKDNRLIELLS